MVGINAAQTSRLTSQTFHATTADVDAAATAHDNAGTDAYYALASFKDNSSRKVENVSQSIALSG